MQRLQLMMSHASGKSHLTKDLYCAIELDNADIRDDLVTPRCPPAPVRLILPALIQRALQGKPTPAHRAKENSP
jgi:hypothetical protein